MRRRWPTPRVKLTTGGIPTAGHDHRGHEPRVRLEAQGRYRVSCSCGWRGKGRFASSEKARAAWSVHRLPPGALAEAKRKKTRQSRAVVSVVAWRRAQARRAAAAEKRPSADS